MEWKKKFKFYDTLLYFIDLLPICFWFLWLEYWKATKISNLDDLLTLCNDLLLITGDLFLYLCFSG